MNRPENKTRSTSRSHLPLVFAVLNLLMLVMVGKGMIHLSQGAAAGYFELLLGTLGLIFSPWIQNKTQAVDPRWEKAVYWAIPMGLFGIYAFFGMVNPFI